MPTDLTYTKNVSERCGYTLKYIAKWFDFYETLIDLPPFVTWNESERRFEIYSEDPGSDIDTKR